LIDAGIAALTAFAGRRDPRQVSDADLEGYAEFAEGAYLSSDLSKTVGVLFTTNNFLNPSLDPGKRRERVREAVRAYREQGKAELPPCAFCGRPGLRVLHRDDVPILLGRTNVNFYPGGAPGLAICGLCQVALHGLTVGAPRCSGKALVLYADEPAFLLSIVQDWVTRTRKYVELSAQGEAPPAFSAARTRIVEALLRAQREAGREDRTVGLVAYHLSNSGQGPGIEVYPLPSAVVRFVQRATAQRYRDAWSAIERRVCKVLVKNVV
jgi:CRISPR-associated protein Cst1